MHAKADFFAARKDFVVIRTYIRTLKDTLKISFSLYNKLETHFNWLSVSRPTSQEGLNETIRRRFLFCSDLITRRKFRSETHKFSNTWMVLLVSRFG